MLVLRRWSDEAIVLSLTAERFASSFPQQHHGCATGSITHRAGPERNQRPHDQGCAPPSNTMRRRRHARSMSNLVVGGRLCRTPPLVEDGRMKDSSKRAVFVIAVAVSGAF